MFIDKLGEGAFGEVWKGLLKTPEIPEFMVAAKTVKVKAGKFAAPGGAVEAEQELMNEALLMAQVESHGNLVSIIGVITSGRPKTLVLSFCEFGELSGLLKKRAADGNAFSTNEKDRFCGEIAAGMAHLSAHSFVHRDLAARNVLLGSGMVCKVADFGLSRRVQTEDNIGDYYRSTNGVVPVRWTAPEGLTNQKFSSASDMWSFGIVCIEIYTDASTPYPGIKSNPNIIGFVNGGHVHPKPHTCSTRVYQELRLCWAFEPAQRPTFAHMHDFFQATAVISVAGGPANTTEQHGGGLQEVHGAPMSRSQSLYCPMAPVAPTGGNFIEQKATLPSMHEYEYANSYQPETGSNGADPSRSSDTYTFPALNIADVDMPAALGTLRQARLDSQAPCGQMETAQQVQARASENEARRRASDSWVENMYGVMKKPDIISIYEPIGQATIPWSMPEEPVSPGSEVKPLFSLKNGAMHPSVNPADQHSAASNAANRHAHVEFGVLSQAVNEDVGRPSLMEPFNSGDAFLSAYSTSVPKDAVAARNSTMVDDDAGQYQFVYACFGLAYATLCGSGWLVVHVTCK